MNYTKLSGRIASPIELRNTITGKSVANFSIAVSRDYKDKEGNYPTDFFNCVVWNDLAKAMAETLDKGNLIELEGSLQTRIFADKTTGKNRTVVEILVSNVTYDGKKVKLVKPETPEEKADREFMERVMDRSLDI